MVVCGSVYTSRADSGSEENIIALGMVGQLRLNVDTATENQREFRLGNGKVIKALGRVRVEYAFAVDPQVQISCIFYVFHSLITPLIMGMCFLSQTETLSKHRHRLRPRPFIPRGPLQLCSINNPRRRLYCVVEGDPMLANADTGSEVDLISLNYARRKNSVWTQSTSTIALYNLPTVR